MVCNININYASTPPVSVSLDDFVLAINMRDQSCLRLVWKNNYGNMAVFYCFVNKIYNYTLTLLSCIYTLLLYNVVLSVDVL